MSEQGKILIRTFGTYKKTIYRNEFNGYCVFQLLAADEHKLKTQDKTLTGMLTCVGFIPDYTPDTPLYVEGYTEKTDYGYQLQIVKVETKSWSVTGLTTYLCNICSGVGITTASAIAEIFGNTLFDVVRRKDGPDIISASISSISFETAVKLCETIGSTMAQKEVFDQIVKYGGSWGAASKIVDSFGANAVRELTEDPYMVGMNNGMDFQTCDKIAKAAGLEATSPSRLKHALIAAFSSEKNAGHVFSDEESICKKAKKILRKSVYSGNDVPSAVLMEILEKDDAFVIEMNNEGYEAVYLRWLHKAETETANNLKRLMNSAVALNYDENIVDWAEKNCGITYAEKQRESFKLLKKTGVAIVTGGPGTGKSTTVNGLISAYEYLNPNKIIRLCAPTGRAAQRMTETTGREAVTIHRLLDFRPFGNDTVHKNASDPIVADLIIVDEASMLDIELAAIFLGAIQSGALVLFIGDINQLPPVGAGNVLHDLIGSGCIPTVHLNAIFRQGSESSIIVNSRRVNEGLRSVMVNEDFKLSMMNESSTILLHLISLVRLLHDPEKPFDVQVLAPTHKGDAGVASINAALQKILNPPNGQPEMKYGNRVYRVGDKVILLNNNYSVGYYNGDIGVITNISSDGVDVDILGKHILLTRKEMEDLNHAFAMTIHKAQGSEFANVVVILPKSPSNMLKRNLLYTAITRAKKRVYVFVEENAYDIAVEQCDTGKRNSWLKERIAKD